VDVRLTEEQELLRQSVREFVARECPLAVSRAWAEAGEPFPPALWQAMAELGWLGLPFAEEWGGAGLGAVELALVQEELGRVLCPAPFYASVVLAGGAVALAGSEDQRRRVLGGLGRGELRASAALLEEGGSWDPAAIALEARPTGRAGGDGATDGTHRLRGTKLFVPDAEEADLLVVSARTGGVGVRGISLFLVETASPGISARRIHWPDLTRPVCEVRFDDVAAGPDAVLGKIGEGAPVLASLLDRARVALAAEMCGGAERVLELSVAFARTREQFGRPIGAFQAIQHRCADMWLQVEGARSAVYHAAWSLDAGEPDAHVGACMAKAYASDAFARVAGDGIQIHGGLGFTWEQEPHLYYKRAKATQLDLGDGPWNRAEIARALLDGRHGDGAGLR